MTNRWRRQVKVSALADAERRRGLEVGWLATLVAAAGAIGASWLLGAIELNVSLVLWTFFGLALGGLALDFVLAQAQGAHGLNAGVELGHALKILGLGALWHLVGGIDNVTFLPVFLLPVLTAAMLLMRRQALLMATLTAGAVNTIALWESPGLQRHIVRLGLPLESLFSRLPSPVHEPAATFLGLGAGPEFQVAALVMFTLMISAAAILSCVLSARTLGLFERFLEASFSQGESASLLRSAIRQDPVPTVLVYADTAQIVEASRGFVNHMLLRRDLLAGATLFDCVAFACPDAVRALLARPAGELKLAEYCVGTEYRVASVRSHRFQIGGLDFASITLVDKNELSYLWEACDALDHPLLVVRNGCEVVYFNAAARGHCEELYFGVHPSRFFQPARSLHGWSDGDVVLAANGEAMRVQRFDLPETAAGESLALLGLFPADAERAIGVKPAGTHSMEPSSRRPSHAGIGMAMAFLLMVGPGTATAQTVAPAARSASLDTLVANAERTDIAAGPQGGTGSIEWVHTSSRNAFNAGLISSSIGETSWTYGRAGAMRRPFERTTVQGQADVGVGHERQRKYGYRAAQGSIAYELVDNRLALEFQDRYIDVDSSSGNIVKLGLTVLPVRPLSVAAALHASTNGNVDARSASLKVEAHFGGRAVIGGMSAGRSQPVLLGLSANAAVAQTLREAFGGVTVPVKRVRVTLLVDSLELGPTRRRSLIMTWMVPI